MKHIVLLGDSIFDNASYVHNGDAVIDQIKNKLSNEEKITMLAVDGDVTTDVLQQIKKMPKDPSHIFVSCGGNDALRSSDILHQKASSVGDAMLKISKVIDRFESKYQTMVCRVKKFDANLTLCTIHDSVPNIDVSALTALALFNESILKIAVRENLPIIDLRVACSEVEDYSQVSPIEPSKEGGRKICDLVMKVTESHDFESSTSAVYA